uniref:Uncharacterized protein n=1 Tax=Setaria viridis TaxID=4556 RepID=A0A4U6VM43_SETVI|nr:hypothetical protein SEVIR_2G061450v2 [Setaria viridis]
MWEEMALIFFSGVGILEIATLALDEPEMESVSFEEAVEVENVEEGMQRLKKFRKS